jgi:hypothetical protein
MIANRERFRREAWEWTTTRPWLRILTEAILLLLFVLSSTRLLRQ